MNKTLTRVHSDDETANDEHLKRLGLLTEGEQQSRYDSEDIIYQKCSSSTGREEEGRG